MLKETPRFADRIAGSSVLRLALFVALVAYLFPGFFSDAFKLADYFDDHQFFSWEHSDRQALVHYGQIPEWNPYWCGGTAGASAPEDAFFAPDFWLRIAFGVEHGRRLAILVMIVMGMEGMYRLSRSLDSSVVASLIAAVIFATCDQFHRFIHDGAVNFLGFELIPWSCMCFIRGFTSNNYRLLGGFFIAWTLLSAGTYPLPFTLLVLLYLFIAFVIAGLSSKNKWQAFAPVKSLFVMGVVSLGLSLVKLVPMMIFLHQFPRVFTPVEVNSALALVTPFWGRYALVVLLAFVALAFADRRAGIFFGGAIVFLALACGDFANASPFHQLKHLPIFGQLRNPERYMVLVLFFMSVAAARGVTRVEDSISGFLKVIWDFLANRISRLRGSAQSVAVVCFSIAATFFVARETIGPTRDILETLVAKPGTFFTHEAPREYDGEFRQARGNRRDAHVFASSNEGSLYCVAGNPIPESPLLRGDLQHEEYPEDPSKATVTRLAWSPEAIDLEVDAKEPTTIRINQNYNPNFRTNIGRVRNEDGLLVVDVPAGKNTLRVVYRDYVAYFCLAVSLATLIALLRNAFKKIRAFLKTEIAALKTLKNW